MLKKKNDWMGKWKELGHMEGINYEGEGWDINELVKDIRLNRNKW